MTVTSPGSQILEDVELTLTINGRCSVFEEHRIPKNLHPLPAPPEPPKRRSPLNFGFSVERPNLSWMLSPRANTASYLANTGIDIEDGTIITIGRVRPEKPVLSTAFHLFLQERPVDGQVSIDWTLTSTSTRGVQWGRTRVPVHTTQAVFLPATTQLFSEDDFK